MRFVPGALRLAASHGNVVQLWQRSESDKMQFKDALILKGHTARVSDFAIAPAGKLLVSASDDRTLRVWSLDGGAERGIVGPLDSPAACLAWAHDGKTVATGDWAGNVRLWEVWEDGLRVKLRETRVLNGHADNITAVAFSPDGKMLASGSWDGTVRLWDVRTGAHRARLTGHRDEVTCLAFSPDSRHLASGSRDHTVLIWDVAAK